MLSVVKESEGAKECITLAEIFPISVSFSACGGRCCAGLAGSPSEPVVICAGPHLASVPAGVFPLDSGCPLADLGAAARRLRLAGFGREVPAIQRAAPLLSSAPLSGARRPLSLSLVFRRWMVMFLLVASFDCILLRFHWALSGRRLRCSPSLGSFQPLFLQPCFSVQIFSVRLGPPCLDARPRGARSPPEAVLLSFRTDALS